MQQVHEIISFYNRSMQASAQLKEAHESAVRLGETDHPFKAFQQVSKINLKFNNSKKIFNRIDKHIFSCAKREFSTTLM